MKLAILVILTFVCAVSYAGEQEEFEYKTVIKEVAGHRFDVPEDMPIERKDGIIAPIAIDKYIALKFSRLEKKLDIRFEKIEESIKELEQDLKALNSRLDDIITE